MLLSIHIITNDMYRTKSRRGLQWEGPENTKDHKLGENANTAERWHGCRTQGLLYRRKALVLKLNRLRKKKHLGLN